MNPSPHAHASRPTFFGFDTFPRAFVSPSDLSSTQAQTALASSDWNLEQAVTLYFASHDDPAEGSSDEDVEEQAVPSLPSTTPVANTSSSSTNRPPPTNPSNMVRTFRDLQNDDDHGDDDHGDQDPQQDFFAGGEKSGLAVQDPNRRPQDHFRNIMQQAREYVYPRLHLFVQSANSSPEIALVPAMKMKTKRHPPKPVVPSQAAHKPSAATMLPRVSSKTPMPLLHPQTPALPRLV